ncbi:MAG: DMT family transporter [Betaproteobacteria bacterium]|nr:DMT family transporter [Betaproteobacteria bacterium]
MKATPHVSPYLLLTLANLFWAGNWIVSRASRGELPPVALSFWRWVVALLCLLPLSLPQVRRDWPQLRAAWAWLLLFGVISIVAHGEWQRLREFTLNVGDVWILASVLAWSAYTLLLSRRPAVHPLSFLTAISVSGLLFLLPFYLWEMASGRHVIPTPGALAGIVYTGVFPAFLGYILWNRGVAEIGPARAGLFMHLVPAFGILLSMIFLGEAPAPYHSAGIALIFAGIWLNTRRIG